MSTFITRTMKHYPPSPVHWLWRGRIALGKVTLIFGDPGLGKSFLTAFIAATVSRGGPWPDGDNPLPDGGDVIMLSAEDDPFDTIAPRLTAHKADMNRIHFVEGLGERNGDAPVGEVMLDRHIEQLAETLARADRPRLVIIDPISAYMGDADSHNNAQVRAVLKRLSDLARATGVAMVCVTHTSKAGAQNGGKAVHRAMGSLAFAAAARMVWQVCRHPADDDLRLVALVKSNLPPGSAGEEQRGGLSFRIVPDKPGVAGGLRWIETNVKLSADDVDCAEPGEDRGSLAEAIEFIRQALTQQALPAQEMLRQAEAAGISKRSLQRAKPLAGVVSAREPRGGQSVWVWKLAA